jgi:hypothetical protein
MFVERLKHMCRSVAAAGGALGLLLAAAIPSLAQDQLFPVPAGVPEYCAMTGGTSTQEGLINDPGICISKIAAQVVEFRVDCLEPGFQTTIWQGLPQIGGYIDLLGCNQIRTTSVTAAPPGKEHIEGCAVKYFTPGWGGGPRFTNNDPIPVIGKPWRNGPGTEWHWWDFSLQDLGFVPSECSGPVAAAGYAPAFGGLARLRAAGPQAGTAVGVWRWFNGGTTIVQSSGTLIGQNAAGQIVNRGSWTQIAPQTYRLTWQDGGWVDTLRLSQDGTKLEGKNQIGNPVSGTRVATTGAPQECHWIYRGVADYVGTDVDIVFGTYVPDVARCTPQSKAQGINWVICWRPGQYSTGDPAYDGGACAYKSISRPVGGPNPGEAFECVCQ